MRFPSSLGALVTGSILSLSLAQAPEYGDPADSGQTSAAGVPDGTSDESKCVLEGTSTVFVTVLPTGPSEGSGDSQSDGSQPSDDQSDGSYPDDLSPVLTITKTLKPTTTLFVSAGAPSNGADQGDDGSNDVSSALPITGGSSATSVTNGPPASVSGGDAASASPNGEIFTTLTIDIWGSGSGSGNEDGQSGSNPTDGGAEEQGDPSSDVSKSPSKTTIDAGQQGEDQMTETFDPGSQESGALPTAYGDANDSDGQDDGQDDGQNDGGDQSGTDTQDPVPEDPSPWNTIVTDTDVHWTVGADGPSQVTVWSTHTLIVHETSDSPPEYSQSNPDNSQPGWYTSFGPDGKPTIVVDAPSRASGDAQGPSSLTLISSDSPQMSVPSEISYFTGTADDVGTGWPEACQDQGGSLQCSTFTIVGADGQPTVVHSTWSEVGDVPTTSEAISAPWPTATGAPPADLPGATVSGSPSGEFPSDDGEGLPPFTTCVTFTVTGADGLPTAIESTIVAGDTDQEDQASSGLPTALPSISVGSAVPPELPVITTSVQFTITGADGLPTVFESTVIASAPGNPQDVPSDLPQGTPGNPTATLGLPNDGGITTCVSYTFTGTDGLPTVMDSTIVLPTAGGISEASAALPTGIPSIPDSAGGPSSDFDGSRSFTLTVIGADGRPTVLETTLSTNPTGTASGMIPGQPGPIVTGASFSGLPTGIPGSLPSGFPTQAAGNTLPNGRGDITTCTTFTYFGPDGLPTVIESTWTATASGDGNVGYPSNVAGSQGVPTSGLPSQIPFPSGFPFSAITDLPAEGDGTDITTCTSYTVLGPDGLPTVIDSTWVIPGPLGPVTDASQLPAPGQPTDLPNLPSQGDLTNGIASTTCTSYTVLGADGLPTVVETSWTVPVVPAPTQTPLGYPTALPPAAGLPSGIIPFPSPSDNGAVYSTFTAVSIGTDGLPTPVVQTIIQTPGAVSSIAGVPFEPTPGPLVSGAVPGQPDMSDYAGGVPPVQTVLPPVGSILTPVFSDGSVLPGGSVLPPFISGTVTGTLTSTHTVTALPNGGPVVIGGTDTPPSYDDSLGDDSLGDGTQVSGQAQPYDAASGGLPADQTLWPAPAVYGSTQAAIPSPAVSPPCTTLQTSTWTNLIPEQTTTYTLNYPLTTLATVTTPPGVLVAARLVRRQENSLGLSEAWGNSSTSSTTPLNSPSPLTSPSVPETSDAEETPSGTLSPSTPTLCPVGGVIGNNTLDFDDIESGPVFNPINGIWFSEGFSVVPPSSQPVQFLPSSGGQLVEFLPPSLSTPLGDGSSDTAEIGVGPHFSLPCFKFNLYGASLGCAAEGSEQ